MEFSRNAAKLENLWTAYAAGNAPRLARRALGGMAAATGAAAVFSLSSRADAGLVHVNVNKEITWNNTEGGVASTTVTFQKIAATGSLKFKGSFQTTFERKLGVVAAEAGNFLLTSMAGSNLVKKIATGSVVTANRNFKNVQSAGRNGAFFRVKSSASTSGSFGLNGTSTAAFKLNNGDIGFIQLKLGDDGANPGYPDSLTILGYTVEANPVPEPPASASIMGMLLLAGAGSALQSWRKRKLAPVVAAE